MTSSIGDSRFSGALIGRNGDYLLGWAFDNRNPDALVVIDVWGDGQWLGTARAGHYLPVKQAGLPEHADGHFFVFPIPRYVWQGVARIDARVSNHELCLLGSVFTRLEADKALSGQTDYVENDGGLRLWGWAWDLMEPQAQLSVLVYENGTLLAECVAKEPSAEPEADSGNNVAHGFSLTLPFSLADGRVHEIRVVTAKGKPLAGSPLTVFLPAGVKSWAGALALPDDDRRVLSAMMERYVWHVPVSMDFSAYPVWRQKFAAASPANGGTIPVLVAVTGAGDVTVTVDSLRSQTYDNWEAWVLGAHRPGKDGRITYIDPDQWLQSLRQRLNEFDGILSFVEAGDILSDDALAQLAQPFAEQQVNVVYSDCDYLDSDGSVMPWFKPDWDPDLFLAATPLHYLFGVRAQLIASARQALDEPNAWPWLAVRAVGDEAASIRHIAKALYRRCAPQQPEHLQAMRACDEVLAPGMQRSPGDYRPPRLSWPQPAEWPKVTLIIPTRDKADLLRRCIDSIAGTDYPRLDIIVMDNDSAEPQALSYLEQLASRGGAVRVEPYPGTFNFSAINNRGVQLAEGELIGLINNDIEALDAGWLKAMVTHLLRPGVGAVGAKLLWPNGMVQHAGVVLGLHGLVGHIGNNWYRDDPGYFDYNRITRSVSAVTGACLLCRRADYLAVGGLNETDFPVNFNDVDFCLKLRRLGKRIVWTPDATLLHAESASRGKDKQPDRRSRLAREKDRFMQKWRHWIIDDPYYNPNLNLENYSHAGLAIPPRGRALAESDYPALRENLQQTRSDE